MKLKEMFLLINDLLADRDYSTITTTWREEGGYVVRAYCVKADARVEFSSPCEYRPQKRECQLMFL